MARIAWIFSWLYPYTGRGARTDGPVSDRTRLPTPATSPRSTPFPKTSTHTSSW